VWIKERIEGEGFVRDWANWGKGLGKWPKRGNLTQVKENPGLLKADLWKRKK
jgi:hypothetical protein